MVRPTHRLPPACVGLALALALTPAWGQEKVTAELIRTLTDRWVASERALADERRAAEDREQRLRRLIALREAEVAALEARADTPEAPAGSEREALRRELAEAEARVARRSDIGRQQLPPIERSLATTLRRLPPPLQATLVPRGRALERAETRTLAERLREVTAILREIEDFDQKLTLTAEGIRFEDGAEHYVRTLYLGTGAAFFIDDSGQLAGTGGPGEDAWTWVRRPELSGAIAEAVESLAATRKDTPLIDLPLTVRSRP